jgi:hypothetical protein
MPGTSVHRALGSQDASPVVGGKSEIRNPKFEIRNMGGWEFLIPNSSFLIRDAALLSFALLVLGDSR